LNVPFLPVLSSSPSFLFLSPFFAYSFFVNLFVSFIFLTFGIFYCIFFHFLFMPPLSAFSFSVSRAISLFFFFYFLSFHFHFFYSSFFFFPFCLYLPNSIYF
jgi:hypothetical protein